MHVNIKNDRYMNSFGSRLREERERLGMSQAEFGALGGVKRLAQANYEADKRDPDVTYLMALAEKGVDVFYLVSGVREKDKDEYFEARSWVLTTLSTMLGFEADDIDMVCHLAMKDHAEYMAGKIESERHLWLEKLFELLENSPRVVMMSGDPDAIAKDIELMETICQKVTKALPREKRIRAIVTLYRSFKASGKIDEKMIEDVVSLADA
ncbi:helix-turn-helix domain-containing protein [Methylocaldum gracile subsp. desertum]|uniref:helix-turn-helix domain-containing protein n=1 Tax=Methylocaldum sp. GT1BW TaxID=3438964 RepID=UPI003DA12B4C